LICVDDGSTDESRRILEELARGDSRLRVVSRKNTGPAGARNEALALARAPLVAIMDADDISLPGRLAAQAEFLRLRPDVVCVGSRILVIDQDGDPVNLYPLPLTHDEIDDRHVKLGQGGGIMHSAAMMRTSTLRLARGYRSQFEPAEDLDLWLRIAELGRLANLEEVVVQYRLNPNGLSHTRRSLQNRQVEAAVLAARRRRGLENLPPPASFGSPDAVDLLRAAVQGSSHLGFWKSAQKYSLRLVRRQPHRGLGWRVLALSTLRRMVSRREAITAGERRNPAD
jgi:glycosyltransferase involved in cell wall biosynthesis